jgi:hypothetical protein
MLWLAAVDEILSLSGKPKAAFPPSGLFLGGRYPLEPWPGGFERMFEARLIFHRCLTLTRAGAPSAGPIRRWPAVCAAFGVKATPIIGRASLCAR